MTYLTSLSVKLLFYFIETPNIIKKNETAYIWYEKNSARVSREATKQKQKPKEIPKTTKTKNPKKRGNKVNTTTAMQKLSMPENQIWIHSSLNSYLKRKKENLIIFDRVISPCVNCTHSILFTSVPFDIHITILSPTCAI